MSNSFLTALGRKGARFPERGERRGRKKPISGGWILKKGTTTRPSAMTKKVGFPFLSRIEGKGGGKRKKPEKRKKGRPQQSHMYGRV